MEVYTAFRTSDVGTVPIVLVPSTLFFDYLLCCVSAALLLLLADDKIYLGTSIPSKEEVLGHHL